MFALLLGAGAIYLLLGDLTGSADPARCSPCFSVGITVVQETRTERVLESLRDLTSPRALVIRDGDAAAHRRPRRGARRHHGAGRGRPGAGRRHGCRSARS